MNRVFLRLFAPLLACMAAAPVFASEALWKAGMAKAVITPSKPLWMAGYGGRAKPAEGKVMDLWVKVLALEDARGRRAVIASSDILGFPRSMYEDICAGLKAKFGLERDQVLLTSTHTHCGPVLRGALTDIYPLDQKQTEMIDEFSTQLEATVIESIGKALADLAPARLAFGEGRCGFAVNRRNNPEGKVPQLIAQGALKGPVDHSAPVFAVFLPDGKLKAVFFGYACHNTTMDFYNWSGDYAGFAQNAIEKSHPGAVAMFFSGCGADQNPLPRRRLELAERYGNMLAAAVEEVLLAPPQTLPPALQTSMEMVMLKLDGFPTQAELEKMRTDKSATVQRWSARLLAELKAGKEFERAYPYPLAVWRLGGSRLLISMGGEPVVDWPIKFKKAFGKQTIVAGYCNDVMAYIPSKRVLKEGGYEGATSMRAYGMPAARWADDVEDLITQSARRQVRQVTRKTAGK